jgi:hypothetical protein
MNHRRIGATSPVVLVLLALILAALIALLIAVLRKSDGQGSGPTTATTLPTTDRPISRDGVIAHGHKPPEPSRPLDTQRIQQTYQTGHTYRSLLKVSLNAKASSKDWGVVADSTLQYLAEAEILRSIESNGGTTLVLLQEFRRARCLSPPAAWTRAWQPS